MISESDFSPLIFTNELFNFPFDPIFPTTSKSCLKYTSQRANSRCSNATLSMGNKTDFHKSSVVSNLFTTMRDFHTRYLNSVVLFTPGEPPQVHSAFLKAVNSSLHHFKEVFITFKFLSNSFYIVIKFHFQCKSVARFRSAQEFFRIPHKHLLPGFISII